MKYTAGVDVGSTYTKAVILSADGRIAGKAMARSGFRLAEASEKVFEAALSESGIWRDDVAYVIGTGFGRFQVPFRDVQVTDLTAAARGAAFFFPGTRTVLDVGGQTMKATRLDEGGRVKSFRLNDKCAAGTGAFLEEMANRLDVSLEEMNALAAQAGEMIKLGSYCTVFSATEVLENIRAGRPVPDIVKGIFYSMIKRVLEMDSLGERVVMTGGVVAHNPYLVEMTAELIERPVLLGEQPQFVGAIGAALHARDDAAGAPTPPGTTTSTGDRR